MDITMNIMAMVAPFRMMARAVRAIMISRKLPMRTMIVATGLRVHSCLWLGLSYWSSGLLPSFALA